MKAGVEAVYRAWTEPSIYNQWSGGRRFVSESVEMDVRPGGRIRQTIRETETGTRWMFDGEYREVAPLRRLVFTFHWRSDAGVEHETSLVCVEFQPCGPDECELTITHTGMPDEAYREGTVQGWSEWIDKLEAELG